MDGGIRSGQDVLRAMALGAKGTMIGRAFLYELAAGGKPGVQKVLEIIRNELDLTMAFCGHRHIDEVDADILLQAGLADNRQIARRAAGQQRGAIGCDQRISSATISCHHHRQAVRWSPPCRRRCRFVPVRMRRRFCQLDAQPVTVTPGIITAALRRLRAQDPVHRDKQVLRGDSGTQHLNGIGCIIQPVVRLLRCCAWGADGIIPVKITEIAVPDTAGIQHQYRHWQAGGYWVGQ